MKEHEWLHSTDPHAMLTHINDVRLFISPRKLRLFACACCRQAWHLFTDERARRAVEAVERYLDDNKQVRGMLSVQRLLALPELYPSVANTVAWLCTLPSVDKSVIVDITGFDGAVSRTLQANILRDIVGSPFQPIAHWRADAAATTPLWWAEVFYGREALTIRGLAEAAYQQRVEEKCRWCKGSGWLCDGWRKGLLGMVPVDKKQCSNCHGTGRIPTGHLDPDRLAVLSDALEEAGCTDEAILRHLRGEVLCPQCIGKGLVDEQVYITNPLDLYSSLMHPRSKQIICPTCYMARWIPKCGPCVRGCHIIDTLTGRK